MRPSHFLLVISVTVLVLLSDANAVSEATEADQHKFSTANTPDRQFAKRGLKVERVDFTRKRLLRVSDKAGGGTYSSDSKSSSASGSDDDEERMLDLSSLPFLEQIAEEFEEMTGTGEAVHHTLHANEITVHAKEAKEKNEDKSEEGSADKSGSSDSASGSSSKSTTKKHVGHVRPSNMS